MDSKGPNFTVAETRALLEGVKCHYCNKPFKKGEYTDVILDIIGGENSKALHGSQGVVEESEPVPPNAEETFILDLTLLLKYNLDPHW
ncbi:uncharacterized protein LOC107710894 [Tachysurus ichikawai]